MTFFYSKFDVKKMARRMQKQIICSLSTSNNKNKDIIFYWLKFCLRWEIVIGKNMCSLQVRDLLDPLKDGGLIRREPEGGFSKTGRVSHLGYIVQNLWSRPKPFHQGDYILNFLFVT